MPRLSVWMVRTALAHLIAGFAIGALLLAGRAAPPVPELLAQLRPLHVELLVLGWIVNLGFGVGYWILPARSDGSGREADVLVGTAFILLNAGVLLAGFGQVQGPMTILPLLGRVAEAAAAAAFAAHTWKRIRPYGTGSRVT